MERIRWVGWILAIYWTLCCLAWFDVLTCLLEADKVLVGSGCVWRRTKVDSQCECNMLITLKEKEVSTQVMECKACGCETGCMSFVSIFSQLNLLY